MFARLGWKVLIGPNNSLVKVSPEYLNNGNFLVRSEELPQCGNTF